MLEGHMSSFLKILLPVFTIELNEPQKNEMASIQVESIYLLSCNNKRQVRPDTAGRTVLPK